MVADDLSQRLWRHGAKLAWEAEGDADRGWAQAQKQQDECQEWVNSYKSLRDWTNAKVAAQNLEIEGLKEEIDAHSGPECMATAMALELAEAEIDRLRKWEERHKDCAAAERLLDEYQAEAVRVLTILHDVEDMLSYLDLHMPKFPITQLTTPQKDLYAELVDAGSLRSWEEDEATDPEDPEDQPRTMDRWWD
jgi:hypothetical protein